MAILDLSKAYIFRKQCKIRGKLALITNWKSHMSFRLVRKSVTLNDLERRSGYFTEFDSFRGPLSKSGSRYTDTFCGRNVVQVI